MPTRQNWFEGWRLFAVLTLTLLALSVWIAGMRQFEVEGVRMVIRFTARSSLLLFCMAFSAAALARLWPNAWTRWQRRNRRYLGVTFAASHGIHAVAIAAFAVMDPAGFAAATSIASYIFGGIGYAFIIVMTATSFDRTAKALGAQAWRRLHLIGRLLSAVPVHSVVRQADSGHAALRAVPDSAGRRICLADDQHGGGADATSGRGGMTPVGSDQMKLPAQPVMHGDHGAIDVADQAVAKDDIGDFPVAPAPDIRHRLNAGDAGRLASRLAAQRFIGDLCQLRIGLSDRRRHWWPRPSSSSARAFVMLRMHSPASMRAMVPSPMP